MFGMRLSERGFVSEKIKRGQHKDRKGWLGIGLRADDQEPEDSDDEDDIPPDDDSSLGNGPPGGGTADDHPREKKPVFTGKTRAGTPKADDSGSKNQNLPYETPRVKQDTEKRSASSASFAVAVSELFFNPPNWLRRQVGLYHANPSERMLRPLCSSVASTLYNDPRRGEEIRAQVEDELGRWDR